MGWRLISLKAKGLMPVLMSKRAIGLAPNVGVEPVQILQLPAMWLRGIRIQVGGY